MLNYEPSLFVMILFIVSILFIVLSFIITRKKEFVFLILIGFVLLLVTLIISGLEISDYKDYFVTELRKLDCSEYQKEYDEHINERQIIQTNYIFNCIDKKSMLELKP